MLFIELDLIDFKGTQEFWVMGLFSLFFFFFATIDL